MSSSVLLRVLMHKFRGHTLEDVVDGQSEEGDSELDEQNNVSLKTTRDLGSEPMAGDSVRAISYSDEDEKNECQHSSEEELEVINRSKRKWSSDDEVRELTARRSSSVSLPIEFCTSPPTDARRPERSVSPPAKLCHCAALDDATPKKRHRQNHAQNPITPRPYLDFEKMQQLRTRAVSAWRPSRQVSLIC